MTRLPQWAAGWAASTTTCNLAGARQHRRRSGSRRGCRGRPRIRWSASGGGCSTAPGCEGSASPTIGSVLNNGDVPPLGSGSTQRARQARSVSTRTRWTRPCVGRCAARHAPGEPNPFVLRQAARGHLVVAATSMPTRTREKDRIKQGFTSKLVPTILAWRLTRANGHDGRGTSIAIAMTVSIMPGAACAHVRGKVHESRMRFSHHTKRGGSR